MRLLSLFAALIACGNAGPALSQTGPTRTQVAVVVVTLDQVRQVQTRHGRSLLDLLSHPDYGAFDWVEGSLAPEAFASCQDERADRQLDYCIRYYLTRADLAADAPPTVVVAFDDRIGGPGQRPGEMRITCYGRGVVPAEAAAQDTWLWADSARLHGVNDWHRDRGALAACISAAASEPWTGHRQPDGA